MSCCDPFLKKWKGRCVNGWKMRQRNGCQWCCDERKGRDNKGWIQNYLKSMRFSLSLIILQGIFRISVLTIQISNLSICLVAEPHCFPAEQGIHFNNQELSLCCLQYLDHECCINVSEVLSFHAAECTE